MHIFYAHLDFSMRALQLYASVLLLCNFTILFHVNNILFPMKIIDYGIFQLQFNTLIKNYRFELHYAFK